MGGCMTLIYVREVKGHFKATFFSLKTFLEGGKKQTSQTQHISMSRVFVCLFICLTALLKNRLVKLLACWYNFAHNMKWLSIPVSETDFRIIIASFCFGKKLTASKIRIIKSQSCWTQRKNRRSHRWETPSELNLLGLKFIQIQFSGLFINVVTIRAPSRHHHSNTTN